MTDQPWPTELRLSADKRVLNIAFESGEAFALPAEFLRVESPSAEVQGHGSEPKKIVPGQRNVIISSMETVGNYAIRLCFSDGHATGLYSWVTLFELGKNQEGLWQTYVAALAANGGSRDT